MSYPGGPRRKNYGAGRPPSPPSGGWSPPSPPSGGWSPPSPPSGGWSLPPAPPAPPPPTGGWQSPPTGGWQSPPPTGGWQPPPAPSYGPSVPGGPGGTETLATVSLVFGILSFVVIPILGGIVAIVTGALARRNIRASGGRKSGGGKATAGLVLGILNVALCVIGIIALVAIGSSGNHVDYTTLRTGDCFNTVSSSSIFSGQVTKIDCSKPHDVEVTGSFNATGSSYPGTKGFRPQAEPQCATFATQYLAGRPTTGLRLFWVVPQKGTWDSGTHTVVCGLQNADASKHTGSLRG